MPLQAGQKLLDRYQIEAQLGAGGMGAVYRAHDTLRDQPCAVKQLRIEIRAEVSVHEATLLKPLGSSPPSADEAGQDSPVSLSGAATFPHLSAGPISRADIVEQFRTEARLLARLSHPGLTQVLDYFALDDDYYLVTALVEGQDLATRLEQEVNNRCPQSQVLEWMDQVLKTLAYCHRERVIHCDIKPENIIVRPDGTAVLVDFGIAQSLARDGRVIPSLKAVTHGYSPPEQYEGRGDPRSDIYAVGATMYHLLAGVPPAPAAERQQGTVLQSLSELVPGVSPRVSSVVARALELNPQDRWQSAEEMRSALPPIGRLNRTDMLMLGARVGAMAWFSSRDGQVRLAAGCSDKTVKMWEVTADAAKGRLLQNLVGHTGYICTIAFAPDGNYLASGSRDGSVRVWRPEDGRLLHTLLDRDWGAVLSLSFSPVSEILAAGYDDDVICLWDYRQGKAKRIIQPCGGHVFTMSFGPNGDSLIFGTSSGTVARYDMATQQTHELDHSRSGAVRSLAVSPDGRWVAAGDMDGYVYVWDLPRLKVHYSIPCEPAPVWGLSFSPDSRWLAIGSNRGTLMLREVESGFAVPLPLVGHQAAVRSVAFAPAVPRRSESRMLLGSGSEDGTLRLWWLE